MLARAYRKLTFLSGRSALFNRAPIAVIWLIGAAAMVVAGYFLVLGITQTETDPAVRLGYIAAGILIQLSEAAAFTAIGLTKSLAWRRRLMLFGGVLFLFSVVVTVIAQAATVRGANLTASALSSNVDGLRAQIEAKEASAQQWRLNAERQSLSKIAASRALAAASLERAEVLEQSLSDIRLQLSDQMAALKPTTTDIFEMFGDYRKHALLCFLVARAVLIELCGLVMLSFAGSLRRDYGCADGSNMPIVTPPRLNQHKRDNDLLPDPDGSSKKKKRTTQARDVSRLADNVIELFRSGKIKRLTRDQIRSGLAQHLGEKVGSPTARALQQIATRKVSLG